MSDHNHEFLQSQTEKKAEKRQSRRPKMKMSGRQVRKLQQLIKSQGESK